MNEKELLSYKIIDVLTPLEQIIIEDLFQQDTNVLAVELRGKVDVIKLSQLYIFLRPKVQEIIYRMSADNKAFVLYSIIDQEKYYRNSYTINQITWKEHELNEMLENQMGDKNDEIEIDLDDSEINILNFLKNIYSINRKKKRVVLKGNCHPYIFLSTLEWFLDSSEIYFENTKLK